MSIKWKTASTNWFMHFCVEVVCFYCLYRLFDGGDYWWIMAILYDALAFAPQVVIGEFFEKHPRIKPFPIGGITIIIGAIIMVLGENAGTLFFTVELIGLFFLTIGNGILHIAGALRTLRVSDGRLSESAIFVGGGSFGVITGRLLAKSSGAFIVIIIFMLAATILSELETRRDGSDNNFIKIPCKHDLVKDVPIANIVLILGGIVIVRGYIGYGLPTAWNQTTIQTIFLFCFMGLGKMLGGILSDILGARKVGVLSCIIAIPCLLISNNIMWLSLIGVALFSMTMAITLGGLVSALKDKPGIAFGVTTLGLFLGTVPMFFFGLPSRMICDILITVMSILSAAGFMYCLKKDR